MPKVQATYEAVRVGEDTTREAALKDDQGESETHRDWKTTDTRAKRVQDRQVGTTL